MLLDFERSAFGYQNGKSHAGPSKIIRPPLQEKYSPRRSASLAASPRALARAPRNAPTHKSKSPHQKFPPQTEAHFHPNTPGANFRRPDASKTSTRHPSRNSFLALPGKPSS